MQMDIQVVRPHEFIYPQGPSPEFNITYAPIGENKKIGIDGALNMTIVPTILIGPSFEIYILIQLTVVRIRLWCFHRIK
jgi:hypothetical protein